jgi:hypothetical protein
MVADRYAGDGIASQRTILQREDRAEPAESGHPPVDASQNEHAAARTTARAKAGSPR